MFKKIKLERHGHTSLSWVDHYRINNLAFYLHKGIRCKAHYLSIGEGNVEMFSPRHVQIIELFVGKGHGVDKNFSSSSIELDAWTLTRHPLTPVAK